MRINVGMRVVVAVLLACGVWAQSSADRVAWDVIASGGVMGSTSTAYKAWATVGQAGVGVLQGAAYRIHSGFWHPKLPVEAEDEGRLGLPTAYQLGQNYPNPFGPGTTIRYAVPKSSHVVVEIFDLRGRRVRLLTDEGQEPGYHSARWDGKDLSGRQVGSGVYLCRMTARGAAGGVFEQSRELLLVK